MNKPMSGLRMPILALATAALVAGGLSACKDGDSTARKAAASTATSASPTQPRSERPTQAPAQTPETSLHLVPVNGHKLAFHVIPGKLPAIVLDAGGGMDSSEWKKVAPALAAKTGSKVITYDRAGSGKSEEVDGPWRAPKAVADLTAGLRKLGVTKHVVLVSHSLAGEIATYFVREYPAWVDGVVLVDANLPQFFTDEETARLVAANKPKIAKLKKAPSTRKTRQLLAQADNYGPVHRAYHQLTWPHSVPATAIVSAKTPFPTATDAQAWRDAQRKFADAAPNRNLVVADDSSHDVPTDRPDVIEHAVQDMLQQVG